MKSKKYEELTFTDDFMFCKVLENNHELCKELLELLLNIKIKKVESVNKQKSIDITADAKSVRLDVYLEDTEMSVYDVEMQAAIKRDLPKRSRYYQGMIDLNQIEKGAKYSELKKSYIIFICMSDPFENNLPVYTFENFAAGSTEDVPDALKEFLNYLKSGMAVENTFTGRIDDEVRRARKHLEWRTEYMTLQMHYDEIAEEARAETRNEIAKEMLCNAVPVELVARYCKLTEAEVKKIIDEM